MRSNNNLDAFLDDFGYLFRRSESRRAFSNYIKGLLGGVPSKTPAAMAQQLEGVSAHSLRNFLTKTHWYASALDRERIRYLHEHYQEPAGIIAIQRLGWPKQGKHSVGVGFQHLDSAGTLVDSQVVFCGLYISREVHWPLSTRLYLPPEWRHQKARLYRAGVPDSQIFRTEAEVVIDN